MKLIVSMCVVLCLFSGCKIKQAAGAYRPAKAKSTVSKTDSKEKKTIEIAPVVTDATPSVENKKTEVEVEPKPTVKAPDPVPPVEVVEPVKNDSPQAKPLVDEKPITRSESVSVVEGESLKQLKAYSVVIGSFGSKANAERLKREMEVKYTPLIVVNERGMYRVLLASFDDYESARALINQVKSEFADAWVLTAK